MKSKFNIKGIIILAIISVVSFIYLIPCFAANTAKVNVETANIRKTADANAQIIEQAAMGEKVEIIEKSGEWYKVKYNGVEGYLRQDLVEANEANIAQNKTESTQTETKQEQTATTVEATETPVTTPENTTPTTAQEVNEANVAQNLAENAKSESTEKTGVYKCKENVKIKLIPLIQGKEIQEFAKDSTVTVLEINNKWALVEGGANRGWVLLSKMEKVQNPVATENAQTEQTQTDAQTEENKEEAKQEETTQAQETAEVKETKMFVNSEIVNLRATESTSSDSLAKIKKGTEVTVVSNSNGWSKVKVEGKEGYISSALLSDKKPETVTSRSLEEERNASNTAGNAKAAAEEISKQKEEAKPAASTATNTASANTSSKASEICSYAKNYLGCKYVYGGTSPSGFDCSGFTQYVFKHFGISLNRTAEAQASNGVAVSKSNLQAGDLVIFTSHVGIYLGNGSFIHAANPKKGVIITSLSDSYYTKNYITARRVI